MAVASPFQCTAADGEGVWASGMSHSHNELACCAIQYKKGKRKQKHRLKIGWLLSKQSKHATRRLTSPPLKCAVLVTTIFCCILRRPWPKHKDKAYFTDALYF